MAQKPLLASLATISVKFYIQFYIKMALTLNFSRIQAILTEHF